MLPYEVKQIWKKLQYAQGDFRKDRTDADYDLQAALRRLEYSNDLLRNLREQQSKSCLSDVTIKVDGRVFHGHRIVLAAVSPYFETMFTSGFRESTTKEIELKDIDGHIFEMLFNFIYSGKIDLSLDTAIAVLNAADYLQLSMVLADSFSDFFLDAILNKKLKPEDALTVLDFANISSCAHNLYDECSDYLAEHFPRVMRLDNFAEIASFNVVDKGIQRYLFQGSGSEEEMLNIVIGWLKHDWTWRFIYADELLKGFRVGLVPKERVLELMEDEILQSDPACKKMMNEWTADWAEFGDVTDVTKLPVSFQPRNRNKVLIAFGGPEPEVCECDDRHFVKYCRENQSWVTAYSFPVPHDCDDDKEEDGRLKLVYPSAVVVGEDIYLGGGCTDTSNHLQTSQFYKFDGSSYKWTELPKLKTARDCFALIHHEGFLYAIGGRHRQGGLDTIERFNLANQTWDGTYELSYNVCLTSAVVFDGKIFIYGMTDFIYDDYAAVYVLIVFDPVTNWRRTVLEESQETWMGEMMFSSVLVVHHDVLYRVGYKDKYPENSALSRMHVVPQVNQIEVKKLRKGALRACVGDEVVPQANVDRLGNEASSFRIDNELYINIARCTKKTGGIPGDWDNGGWSKCQTLTKQCVMEYPLDFCKY